MTWLADNYGTILVSLLLLAAVTLITRKLIRDKKKGKSSCGCGCSHCAMAGQCHKTTEASQTSKMSKTFQTSKVTKTL